MIIKKRTAILLITGVALGWLIVVGGTGLMSGTSETGFCLSCHSMQIPYEEYQGTLHYSNASGNRTECADCHIPENHVDYALAKIRTTRNIYHEFITRKINTEKRYESNRKELAEIVWTRMRKNNSATCRKCHSDDVMDLFEQSEFAAEQHQYGIDHNKTCIDCHKGIVHFLPEEEKDSTAYNELITQTGAIPGDTRVVYPAEKIKMGDLGIIYPGTRLSLIETREDKRIVELTGYQMQGAEGVLYLGKGQRAIIAILSGEGRKALTKGNFEEDRYGNKWRSSKLIAGITDPVLGTTEPLWNYANDLNNFYCTGCHAKIPPEHYTVNAWPAVVKSMGESTNISDSDLDILISYLQYHAKDKLKQE